MKVFYIDDEIKALEKFSNDHAKDGMSVETCNEIPKVIELLSSRQAPNLPDVIVMDLYSTKDSFDSTEASEINVKVDELVKKIALVRTELQAVVEHSKTPTALDTLRDLRKHYKLSHIPVVITSREGITLLGDNLFRETIDLDATWMLKGRDSASQRQIISRALNEARSKQRGIKRDIQFLIYGALLSAGIGALLQLMLA